jgi:hypothetical protein
MEVCMRTVKYAAVVALLVLFPRVGYAATITLDFERFPGPDGRLFTGDDIFPGAFTNLTTQFASVGIVFTSGTLFQDGFYDGNPANHFLTSSPIIASLTIPVFALSMESRSYWNATLTAFDAANRVLAQFTLPNPTPGVSPLLGVLTVTSAVPIDHFSVLPPLSGQILNVDNLTLTTGAAVPEPGSAGLAATALLLCAWLRRRRVAGTGVAASSQAQ